LARFNPALLASYSKASTPEIQTPLARAVHPKMILLISSAAPAFGVPANLARVLNLCSIPARTARSFE
jgi:hypothetical protein